MMPFERHVAVATRCLLNIMGVTAIWYQNGDRDQDGIPAKVLFNSPSVTESVNGQDYNIDRPTIEYLHTQLEWEGLKERIESKQFDLIEVNGKYYRPIEIESGTKIKGFEGSTRDGGSYRVTLTLYE